MNDKENMIRLIKTVINRIDPNATLILYGSYARGDYTQNSDLDLLILIDKEKITRTDQKRIKYPLYDIEFETGTIISPLVLSKKIWQSKHKKTPFYENISREGQIL